MKRNYSIFFAVMMITSLTMIGTPEVASGQNPEITIGALGPLAIPVGVDMENGVDLAVAKVNAEGGVDVDGTAHDFAVVTETTSGDDGLPDPTVAATNLQNMILNDGVVAVIGGFRTEVVLGAIQPTINETGTPFLGVGSTAPIITEYYYRVGPPNGTVLATNLAALYGTYLVPEHNVSKVVVLREDAAWTGAILDGITPALVGSFNMTVDSETVDPIPESASGSDVQSAMDALTNMDDVDALMTLFSAPVGQVVTEAWAALGLNENMFLAGINVAAQDSEYFTNTGGSSAGEIMVLNAPPNENPTSKTQAFREAYIAEYGEEPTYTAFAAYDSVYILKEAIETTGEITSSAIHAELPNIDYVGVATRYKFTTESSAGQVASPAVPESFKVYDNATVHDLYTPSTIGVSGFPYSQLYFGQWLEDGEVTAIWAGTAEGYTSAISPPYEAETAGSDDSDTGLFPGFELYVGIFGILVFVLGKKKNFKLKNN